MPEPPKPAPAQRRLYVDWLRGLAVLLMVEAHTSDAWTRALDKRTHAFGIAGFLGGFAAPLFLWLAGLGVALAAARRVSNGATRRSAVESISRRGLEIFILAFAFRLQAFIVSPGSHPITIFRVDILNVMGPAIVVAGVLWGLVSSRTRQVVVLGAAALGVAMMTPLVRAAAAVDTLPIWFQWYVRPSADHTTFTALPWAGFVLAGAACGVLVAAATPASEKRLQGGLVAAGGCLVALGWYTSLRPSIYTESSFWTSSPTWFVMRVGIMMLALAACSFVETLMARWRFMLGWLERFGRRSLFVYWIHVELVYGYASWLWRGRLPLWGSIAGCALFLVLLYGAIMMRDRVEAAWRRPARGRSPRSPRVATA